MTTLPQPGEYLATGLPQHYDIFRAWLFLQANNDEQPAMYRHGMTLDLAKSLITHGERRPALISAALLAVMPPAMNRAIKRRVDPACATIVQEFSHHAMTRFAYIDFATPDTKKLTLAMMCATMERMEKTGEDILARLRHQQFQGDDSTDIAVPILPDQRSFMLIYDKVAGSTGNTHLENVYLDAAWTYAAFREDYLYQLSTISILPARAHHTIAAQLRHEPVAPQFDNTLLPDTPEMRAIYAQLSLDPRVKPSQLIEALDIAEIMADSGDCPPDSVAVALLSACLPHIGPQDASFLRDIAGDDVLHTLQTATEAALARVPLIQAPPALQQNTLARAIAAMRDGQQVAARAYEQLSLQDSDLSPADKQRYAAQTTQSIGRGLESIIKQLQPEAEQLPYPALTRALDRQIKRTFDELLRLRNFVTPRNTPSQRPRGNGPSF